MHRNDGDAGSDSRVVLPVIVGLVLGVAFVVSFVLIASSPSRTLFDKHSGEEDFRNIEQIPELKLFMEKYGDHDSTKGFGRSQNGTIQFSYAAFASVDTDTDGIKEAFRRLELSITYDESGNEPIYKNFDPSRVTHLEIRCRELTKVDLDIDIAFTDIMSHAYDGQTKDFIENASCLYWAIASV